MVIIKRGNTVIVRAKNFRHAISIFDSKVGYDLQYALENDGYEIEVV